MDRFIRLRIYDTSDTLLYDNQNDTSWGIESGSMVLDGFIMDSELKFGELNSSMFSCKVFGINEDLRGYKIIVSVGADDGIETNLLTNDGDPILTNDGENITVVQMVDNRIFTGYIVSSRTDTSELYRDIEAYDLAYDLSTKDATAFWNSFWTTNANTTVTLADIRNALLTYFSISYVTPPTLVNDDLVITNTFEGITTVTLTFGTILASICVLQNTCPHFNGSGQLEFYKLGANTYSVMSQIEKYNSEWEDYTTATITGVAIYDTSDNIVKRVGTAGNFYNISGNLFLLGRTAQELDTIGGNMLTELSLITYVPAKLKFIESQLDYRFGDKLVTDRGNTYIFSNRLSGSVLIEQTTSCNALGETLGDIPSDVNDGLVNTHSMHEMINTVDELSSIITDPTTGIQSIVQQLSDKVVLKVQTDGTLALCELSADPSTGTTSFIVKAGNFSVDASGNVTITGNLTAKNKLTMQRKGSSSQIDYSTDVINVIYGEIEVTEGNYELYQETVELKNYKNNALISYRTPIYETSQNPMIYLNAAVMQSGGDFTVVKNLNVSTGNLTVTSGSITVGNPITIANGGTGASTRLNAFKNITNQDVSSNATHFVTFTTNWAKAGYSDVNSVKSVLNMSAGASGNWFNGRTPNISNGGVIEVGKYMDFHTANTQTNDYTFRFTNTESGKLTASGTITQGSSKKIKENIKPIDEEEALKILELEPVSFDYKETFGGDKDHRGFIAEDVDKILPNLTTPEYGDENDLKLFTPMSLTYTEMIPYLVKIAQMQDKKIKSLESRIEKLESIIEKFAIDTIINNTTGGKVNE